MLWCFRQYQQAEKQAEFAANQTLVASRIGIYHHIRSEPDTGERNLKTGLFPDNSE